MSEVGGNLFDTESLDRLRRRAEQAAAIGAATFAIPEAAPVAERVAAMAQPGTLRSAAERWLAEGASYHALARLTAQAVMAFGGCEGVGDAVYVPKAEAELEPILRLWPSVLAVPTTSAFEARELVALRAFPVHPLGLVTESTWADGRLCSPAEYFFHDLDHARFKIREDLKVEGIQIPDPYQDGSTFDARTGRHRTVLHVAEGRIGSALWDRVGARQALSRRLLAFTASLDRRRADAAELLLFEIICEKSHPLDVAVLACELTSEAHVAKIRRKHASGFFGGQAPGAASMDALDEVRLTLREML